MPEKLSSFKRENLRTLVNPGKLNHPVSYQDPLILMGSCFTEHIGNHLLDLKFQANLNPFGIVYNPLAILEQLARLVNPTPFNCDDLVFNHGLWHSWLHHSRFSHPDANSLLDSLNKKLLETSAYLKHSRLLILTFGTAHTYFLKADHRVVANCHQMPADLFYSRLTEPEELTERWISLLNTLSSDNPQLCICLTVSPVRYFKEGPLGNQMSKSALFLFMGKLIKAFPDLFYFPSYEIFMDDLRDYRFYDTDLIHPGAAGVAYVWDRFVEACIDPRSFPLMSEVASISKAVSHRPGKFLTEEHRQFVGQQIDRIKELQCRNPFLNFSKELLILKEQLTSDQP